MFRHPIAIRFHDADPAGILFFGRVYELAHEAYEAFFQELGFEWKSYFANGEWAVPIRHSECEYFAPMQAGSKLEIVVGVEKIGETSMTLTYRFEHEGKAHAQVKLVHAFMSLKTKSKTEMPSVVRERLETYQRQCLNT